MVICDSCGTTHGVRRAFVTIWNGNIVDLCRPCYQPLVRVLDALPAFTAADGQPHQDAKEDPGA